MDRLHDIELMTLTEFNYKYYAQIYKEIDQEYDASRLAFLIRNAEAKINKGTEKKPREVYKYQTFQEFFDYEKAIKEVDQVLKTGKKVEKKPEKKKETSTNLKPWELAQKHNSRKG